MSSFKGFFPLIKGLVYHTSDDASRCQRVRVGDQETVVWSKPEDFRFRPAVDIEPGIPVQQLFDPDNNPGGGQRGGSAAVNSNTARCIAFGLQVAGKLPGGMLVALRNRLPAVGGSVTNRGRAVAYLDPEQSRRVGGTFLADFQYAVVLGCTQEAPSGAGAVPRKRHSGSTGAATGAAPPVSSQASTAGTAGCGCCAGPVVRGDQAGGLPGDGGEFGEQDDAAGGHGAAGASVGAANAAEATAGATGSQTGEDSVGTVAGAVSGSRYE